MNNCLHCGCPITEDEYLKHGGLCGPCVQMRVMNEIQCRAHMTKDEYIEMFGVRSPEEDLVFV